MTADWLDFSITNETRATITKARVGWYFDSNPVWRRDDGSEMEPINLLEFHAGWRPTERWVRWSVSRRGRNNTDTPRRSESWIVR